MQASWSRMQKLSFDGLNLTANGSTIAGNGSVVLGDQPDWTLNLQAGTLNLDSLLLMPPPLAIIALTSRGKARTGSYARLLRITIFSRITTPCAVLTPG
jgi:hypothetical protein